MRERDDVQFVGLSEQNADTLGAINEQGWFQVWRSHVP